MSSSEHDARTPRPLEHELGYRFRDPGLLADALRHASCRTPADPRSNERLEFLGDAVLGLVVGEFLYYAFADLDEGSLTRVRAAVVSTEPLARLGRDLGVEAALELGKGIDRAALPASVLAGAVEAVIGAAYLDGGLHAVRGVVLTALSDAIDEAVGGTGPRSFKSILQERTQRTTGEKPAYHVVSERGPEHRKEFVVAVSLDGAERGRGEGPTKKAAEQAAAREALRSFEEQDAAGGSHAPGEGRA